MAVIDKNPYRTPKRLFTDRGHGQQVTVFEAYDDRVEAATVVDTIASMTARRQANPGDFAVMYRTNAQSRLLEEAFVHASLPYKLVGAQRFYGRREIKDTIAYLRVVHNLSDEVSLTRIINMPPRGIGDKTLISLRTYAQANNLSMGQVLIELGKGDASPHRGVFSGRPGAVLGAFGSQLASWRLLKEELPPLVLMDRILDSVEYQAYVDDGSDEGRDRWENVMELRRLAAEYKDRDLESFLEDVALVSDQDTIEGSANVPTLLTLHAAKGLEFPMVMLVGLNDGTLPHSRSFDDPEEMMEERRLFYVGITRAKDRLFLLYSQNRNSYGYGEPAVPSRFLDDIPLDMLGEAQAMRARRQTRSDSGQRRPDRWQKPGDESPVAPVQQQYRPGMRVIHPAFGNGLVLNSKLQDDDEIVDVFFEKLGLKHLAASIVKMEIKS